MTTVADQALEEDEDESGGRTQAFKAELGWDGIGEM